ncbi:ATP-binding cassette domain-containing protein [Cohnella candidum]|nr:ATP-binding cassette domain-containing protein [Cohnella candidum]
MLMSLELRNVSYQYRGGSIRGRHKKASADTPAALRDVSLAIKEGEMIAVAGRSGSGKSTLLQLLKGFLQPTGGSLLLGGLDPWKERAPERFDDIGLVFQYPEHQLFARTVLDDIGFGPRARWGKADKNRVTDAVMQAMMSMDLVAGEYGHRSPLELSGGEKRRVALAGVLALEPKLLLLDEPTAGLDWPSREALFTLLHGLRQERGLCVIWVSHQMTEMLAHANRLLWLDQGRLVRDGSPASILSDADFLERMGMRIPECFSLRDRLAAAGFRELHNPWDAASFAESLIRGRETHESKGEV